METFPNDEQHQKYTLDEAIEQIRKYLSGEEQQSFDLLVNAAMMRRRDKLNELQRLRDELDTLLAEFGVSSAKADNVAPVNEGGSVMQREKEEAGRIQASSFAPSQIQPNYSSPQLPKVGYLANVVLRQYLERGAASEEEIGLLQCADYSKERFGVQYPVLLKAHSLYDTKPLRYYANKLHIGGNVYFLCSEWYETYANNDRVLLVRWLNLHGEKKWQ
jgi:hypothetical protein